MKMQNMKIVQKWREYAGPKDERLEAENAKIYEFGFILLSFGMLVLLAYEIIAQQVAWVHNGANDAFHLFASPVDAAMYAWLFIVMLICAVLQTRKGYVDTNRFGQTEHLPAGYFLLIAGISGAASALAIAAMRCIAEAQIVPFEDIFWAANLATGVVFGVMIFAATFGVGIYSNIDIISSICMLMARGAVVSMLCVIFILPALLTLCDKLICATTFGMKKCREAVKQ